VVVSKDGPESSSDPASGDTAAQADGTALAATDGAGTESAPSDSEPSDSEASASAPTEGATRDATGPRKPDPGYFTRVFARRQGAVQQCFTTGSAGDDVSLQIVFNVDTRGRVTSASLLPDRLASTASGQCVLRVARGVSFGPLTEPASFRIPVQAKRR
jgi:hypothetical protein